MTTRSLLWIAAGTAVVALGLGGLVWFGLPQAASPARMVGTTAHEVRTGPSEPGVGSVDSGFITGTVTTVDGASYSGRLRWGGTEEAYWDEWFNGVKRDNRWAGLVPPDRLPTIRRDVSMFGVVLFHRELAADLDRPFLARFGDIARIDSQGREVRVTLKSGTVVDLDRFEASDFDDGVTVWTSNGEALELDSLRVRSIELGPRPSPRDAAARLFGTVRTQGGEFRGYLQWHRATQLDDELAARSGDAPAWVAFGEIASIVRDREQIVVTYRDGRVLALEGPRTDPGIAVHADALRVAVPWEAFERLDLEPAPAATPCGRGYQDFPPGGTLAGWVETRSGGRFEGRLVFDLDESETTDALDAPWRRLDLSIPFGQIAAIHLGGEGPARVRLVGGAELELERRGDLGERNAGLLVFGDGGAGPDYLRWDEVASIGFRHEG